MKGASGRFGRADRLLSTRDYRRVSRAGRRSASAAFVVLVSHGKGTDSRCRLGLTVSRKVGSAVTRNRIKRQVREWFRWEGRRTIDALDLVVIARRGAAELSGPAVAEELEGLLRTALELR